MDLGLQAKVALVTGSSRGIGAAISASLAAEGCRLVLTARDPATLGEQGRAIKGAGGEVECCPADLTLPSAAPALVDQVLARFGRLDILIANAGATRVGDFLALSDADWEAGFALKFFGHMRLIRAAWPNLVSSRGAVVAIAGSAGRTPYATSAISGSVNAALLNLVKTLSVRATEEGVHINAINPGAIKTERYAARIKSAMAEHGETAERAEQRLLSDRNNAPLGTPSDVADLVCFLASDRSRHLQGTMVDVDGGKTKTL